MLTLWIALYRLGSLVMSRGRVYKTWSWLYRALWERRLRTVVVARLSLTALADVLRRNAQRWAPDAWQQLWDAVSYPAKAQEVFAGRLEAREGLDCDEFAVYAVAAAPAELRPRLLTVNWLKGFAPSGHNICLLTLPDGTFTCMDYGAPWGPSKATIAEVAAMVVKAYGGDKLTFWSVSSEDLTPQPEWGWN